MLRTGEEFTEKQSFFKEDSEKSQFDVKISAFLNKSGVINGASKVFKEAQILQKELDLA